MNVMTPVRDQGTAYEMPLSTYKAALTEVRRGTPMGELLRRYWHPVGLSANASSTPRQVKALGEDLILFRDGAGKAAFCIRVARIAARPFITARLKSAASVAAIMASSSMLRAIVSNSPASRRAGSFATR